MKVSSTDSILLGDNLTLRKFCIIATPFVLFGYLIMNGLLGIDFGYHWDEVILIKEAVNSWVTGTYLPHNYMYPSLCYYIVVIATKFYSLFHYITNPQELINDVGFRIFLRVIFMSISSLIVFWVYVASYKIARSYWSALIAGLIICSSFEFSYHSRWAVTDCVATQLFTLSAMILFLDIPRDKKIVLSSIIAGVSASAKYTAGIDCILILLFYISELNHENYIVKTKVKEFLYIPACFFLGFFLTTPGVVYEYPLFINGIIYQKNIYSFGHYGYTVIPGVMHFIKICQYALFSLFSKSSFLSVGFMVFAFLGVVMTVKRKYLAAMGFMISMVIYVIYVSTFKVMIVRNLLFILPSFAALSSLGCYCVSNQITNSKWRFAFNAGLVLLLLFSCTWVVESSITVYNKEKINLSDELDRYLQRNREKQFIFSYSASALLKNRQDQIAPTEETNLIFLNTEIPWEKYTANIRNQFARTIGVDDVNFNYYPTWCGAERIVVMKYTNASEIIKSRFNFSRNTVN